MSRKKAFEEGQAPRVTLYHGTGRPGQAPVDPETFRRHGIDVGRAVSDPGKVWATTAPTHQPEHWVHGSGWGDEYRQPSWSHVVEFQMPRSEYESYQRAPIQGGRSENVMIPRSIRPEEITNIHDVHALHGERIARAQELEKAKWAEMNAPKKPRKRTKKS